MTSRRAAVTECPSARRRVRDLDADDHWSNLQCDLLGACAVMDAIASTHER